MKARVIIKISPAELKVLEAAVIDYRDERADNLTDLSPEVDREAYQKCGQDIMYLDSILRAL